MTIQANYSIQRDDFQLEVKVELPSEGVIALFGPSGCGKTTLLRCIAGLESPDSGYLKVKEEVWQNERIFLPCHKRSVGYVFQESSLFPHLNVKQNLEFGYKRRFRRAMGYDFSEFIDKFDLKTLLSRSPETLSGGQQRRIAICRALLTNPRLLLMDEPLTGLDQNGKDEILVFLNQIFTDLSIPVLYVSHSRDEITKLGGLLLEYQSGMRKDNGSTIDRSTLHYPQD